jgi:hypothetical protein
LDSTAKAFWSFLKDSQYCGPIQFAISNEQWSIWKGQEKLPQADHETLYDFICSLLITDWWVSNPRFGDDFIHNINWDACAGAMKLLGLYQ